MTREIDAAWKGVAWGRPRFPSSLIRRVVALARGGRVLNLEAGTGDLARPISACGLPVVAMEASATAIATGRARSVDDRIEWRQGTWETGPLSASGPGGRRYDLVVVGERVRTFPFADALPRLKSVVGGWFAMVGRGDQLDGGLDDLVRVMMDWSRTKGAAIRDEVSTVTAAPRFRRVGHWRGRSETVLQPVPVFVRSLNLRYGLGLDRQSPDTLEAFYRAVEACLDRNNHGGMVRLTTAPWVVWGRIS